MFASFVRYNYTVLELELANTQFPGGHDSWIRSHDYA